jgi:hypothetical protein
MHSHPFNPCPICGERQTYDHGCLCPSCGRPYAYGILHHISCKTGIIRCKKCGIVVPAGETHTCVLTTCAKCGKTVPAGTLHLCVCPRCNRPLNNCICRFIQKVVAEKELSKYLEDGWVLKMQLQSGDVLMEKEVDVETITEQVMEQTNKQVTDELAKADVEKITAKAMEQATKQIAEAVEKERQRLLLKE